MFSQSRRYGGGALVGLAPETKLQALQTEIWNIINPWNFCQMWMSSPLHKRKAPLLTTFWVQSKWKLKYQEALVYLRVLLRFRNGRTKLAVARERSEINDISRDDRGIPRVRVGSICPEGPRLGPARSSIGPARSPTWNRRRWTSPLTKQPLRRAITISTFFLRFRAHLLRHNKSFRAARFQRNVHRALFQFSARTWNSSRSSRAFFSCESMTLDFFVSESTSFFRVSATFFSSATASSRSRRFSLSARAES